MTIGLNISDPLQLELGRIAAQLQVDFPKEIDMDLSRSYKLLGKLGDPHLRLPPVIHVAGTNGKGSCVAYMRAILQSAGCRVHVYTSPHLVRFNERIVLSGNAIQDADLRRYIHDAKSANGNDPLTFFELITAAAFRAFADIPADAVILETGMGGRLDATNVVPNPAATVIMPVSMDHVEFLGDTIEKIAFEKASIQKPGSQSIIGAQDPAALKIIEQHAAAIGANISVFGRDFSAHETPDGFRYNGLNQFDLPSPILRGQHQIANAATAIAAIERANLRPTSQTDFRSGILSAEWPARMQKLQSGPVFQYLGAGDELWLDGGHNPAAGKIIADMMHAQNDAPWAVVMGMLNNKDARGFLKHLRGNISMMAAVAIPGEDKSMPAQDLANIGLGQGIDSVAALNLQDAVEQIKTRHSGRVRIMICGSLYLAGRVLADHR